jgi:hypothetical protein
MWPRDNVRKIDFVGLNDLSRYFMVREYYGVNDHEQWFYLDATNHIDKYR